MNSGFFPAPLPLLLLGGIFLTIFACLAGYGLFRFQTRRMMERIDEMLDRAIDGSFSERDYNESLLSKTETKLNRFLASGALSQKTLAEERNRTRELISDISHQTKTPVANILLYTQLLSEQPGLSGPCRDMADQIGLQTEKLNFLIQSLIKASRLETGIIQVQPVSAQIGDLLDAAVNGCDKKAEQKQIRIAYSRPVGLEAKFDPKWTLEAVGNILDNAIKYSPIGSTVTVQAASYELFTRIIVSDEGMGISEEDRTKIFTRFYRAPEAGSQEGVGLGLYLTREIIAAQGGYVKVGSAPVVGSIFSVFLPTA